LVEEIKGKQIADAAEIIMERAGGQAQLSPMAELMRQAGVIRSPKRQTAYSTTLKTLQRNEKRFYKVREGWWGLTKYRRPDTGPAQGTLTGAA
jgi:hypothetical protein